MLQGMLCMCIVKKSKSAVIGYCIAQYDYEATATNQISLREGDKIAVVSKAGEATGWWKGNNNGRVMSQTVLSLTNLLLCACVPVT